MNERPAGLGCLAKPSSGALPVLHRAGLGFGALALMQPRGVPAAR